MDGRIFHLKERILNNLKQDWKIEEMAEIAELSVPHFQKLFKTQIGMPPIAYLRDLRLERAREFLEGSFHQIKQIGYEVGMRNDSHFTHDFKKKFGVTPTEYRKRHWEKKQVEKKSDRNNIIRQELTVFAKK